MATVSSLMHSKNATDYGDMSLEFFQELGHFVGDYARFEDATSLNYPKLNYPTPGRARGHMIEGANILQEYDLGWSWQQAGSKIGLQMQWNRFRQTSADHERSFDFRGTMLLVKPSMHEAVARSSAQWTNEFIGPSSLSKRNGIFEPIL